MPEDLISHPAYTNEDIAKWLTSQAEAIRKPGAVIPAWVTGGFEDAMKQEKEARDDAAVTEGENADDNSDVQDDVFNFELVYFKVEKTVFTVIKNWLTVESSTFRDMFALPSSGCTPAAVEGTLITNPIVLEHTSAASFKAFLCLFYGPRGQPPQTYNEWVGALELSLRWNFDHVRKQAVAGLNSLLPSLGPPARILLARRFSVAPWLRTGLIDLVTEVAKKRLTRNELMNEKEFALDMTTVANVFYACFELEGNNPDSEAGHEARYCCACECGTWGNTPHFSECKAVKDKARALRDVQFSQSVPLKVDDIFGAEIEGCLYNDAL